MIEFEDKVRDPKPTSWRTRIAITILVLLQLGGCVSQINWIAGSLGLK